MREVERSQMKQTNDDKESKVLYASWWQQIYKTLNLQSYKINNIKLFQIMYLNLNLYNFFAVVS